MHGKIERGLSVPPFVSPFVPIHGLSSIPSAASSFVKKITKVNLGLYDSPPSSTSVISYCLCEFASLLKVTTVFQYLPH